MQFLFFQSPNHVVGRIIRINTGDWLDNVNVLPASNNILCFIYLFIYLELIANKTMVASHRQLILGKCYVN